MNSQAVVTENDTAAMRMAIKRAKARDLVIPSPLNIERRLQCLASPFLFCETYFPQIFYEAFTADRRTMVEAIIDAAMHGGDQSIAGPRGEGKTKIAMIVSLYLMLNMLSEFPVVIGKSQSKSQVELLNIKEKLQQSPTLAADFPEVCYPFRAVGGWSSRARMQTVAGELTNIELASDHLIFPTIEEWQLPDDWPSDLPSLARGQVIASVGIDGPIRGTAYRDKRPTIAVIDDIEDREAAASSVLIAKNEQILEADIAGLGPSATRISRVMLCTIQNRRCIAYRYTDPVAKPSWRGKRFRKMIKPPDRMDLVQQYIELRRSRTADDPDARQAFLFWLDNQSELEAGAVVSNKASFDKRQHTDGKSIELSAVHAYYNRVADFGEASVATEIDNDPPEESGPIGLGLTLDLLQDRCNGLARRQIPASITALTVGIDIGKYRCHWVVTAWSHGAMGTVVDYGVLEVVETDKDSSLSVDEQQIYKALLHWRDEILAKEFVDATGTKRSIDFVLVDSGSFTTAVYEFVRQVRGPFHPSKGFSPYSQRKEANANLIPGDHLHAQRLESQALWLYQLDADYWKRFVHERFLTPTFDDKQLLRQGSLSLFSSSSARGHFSYCAHIVAEEWVSEFIEGKGTREYWVVRSDNNHWLDATALACAAGEVRGIRLVAPSETTLTPQPLTESNFRRRPSHHNSDRFRRRSSGWIPRRSR